MRIVLDTNVVISALLWGGVPLELLRAAVDGDVILFTSPILLDELRRVLARPQFATRLERRRSKVEFALASYAGLAIVVSPASVTAVVQGDPDDDHVIAAAVAARASLVVTGDGDLLRVGSCAGVQIVTPAAAVQIIQRHRLGAG